MQAVQNLNHPGAAMSPVIQIIAGHAVRYTKNNTKEQEYDDGEFYEVPDHVAKGMVKRQWAKVVTEAPGEHEHPGEEHPHPGKEPPPPPVKEPEKPADEPKPEPGDDDDGDEDGGGKHERMASHRRKRGR